MGKKDYRPRRSYLDWKRRQERKVKVMDFKGTQCNDCGDHFDPICLDLHHVDPSTKVATISWIVRNGTMEQLQTELRKVIPLCACCHRLRTRGL